MTDQIFAELKQFRRGHGLRAHDVVERIGPNLRQLCGITESDIPANARRKLTLRLTQECGRLPEPLSHAALVALALDSDSNRAERRFLHQRVKALAETFDRDPRTALRRIDQAFYMLAELMTDASKAGDGTDDENDSDGWYTESLRTTLYLNEDPVRLVEERRIIATADELDEIVLSWSVSTNDDLTPGASQPSALLSYGGEIVEERRVGRSHVDFIVRLPEPLPRSHRRRPSPPQPNLLPESLP